MLKIGKSFQCEQKPSANLARSIHVHNRVRGAIGRHEAQDERLKITFHHPIY